ncbi:MAG: hypothetical protein R3C18_16050 [Planctomycetaceae bacterium]
MLPRFELFAVSLVDHAEDGTGGDDRSQLNFRRFGPIVAVDLEVATPQMEQ